MEQQYIFHLNFFVSEVEIDAPPAENQEIQKKLKMKMEMKMKMKMKMKIGDHDRLV